MDAKDRSDLLMSEETVKRLLGCSSSFNVKTSTRIIGRKEQEKRFERYKDRISEAIKEADENETWG